MKKIIYLLLCLSSLEVIGQDCGTPELPPGMGKIFLNNIVNSRNLRVSTTTIQNEIRWIAIKPWIITNGDDEAISNTDLEGFINALNVSYLPAKIQFYANPVGYIQDNSINLDFWRIKYSDILNNLIGQNTAYNSNEAINVYFVNSIMEQNSSGIWENTGIDGVAPFSVNILRQNNLNPINTNGKSIFNNPLANCIYIKGSSYKRSGANVLSHELGHYFMLFHTFQNSEFKSERDNILGCDFIEDTNIDITKAFLYKPSNSFFYRVEPNTKNCEYSEVKITKNRNSNSINPNSWDDDNSSFISNKSDYFVHDVETNTSLESFDDSKFNNPPINNIMGYFLYQKLFSLYPTYCSDLEGVFSPNQISRLVDNSQYRIPPLVDSYNIFESVPKPSNLVITYVNGKSKLTWNNNGNTLSRVVIERAIGNGVSSPADNAFVKIAELSAGTTSYFDNEISYGTLAFYRVRITGSEDYSNIVPQISSTVPPIISANKNSINAGEPVTITASGCSDGQVYWTTGGNGSSITVYPIDQTTYAAFCGINGVYTNPSNVITITVNYTHHLASAEYFIDTDPGFGFANPLSINTGGGTINQTVAIDMTPHNLSQGVHTISFRVKDDNDNWSLTHTKTFLVLGSSTGGSNSIADVEYFIDSLKQDKSNLVSTGITANNNEQITIAIPQNVPQGVHTVAFRVKDNQGKYSLFHTKTYLVLGSGLEGNTLSKIEYFFDTDPGFGSGTQLDYTAAAGATQMIDIDVSSLSAGVHVLNVRVKNAANQWSLTHAKVFLVMPDLGGNATVSKIEYFIGDNDPGQGSATNVAFTPNPDGKNVIANFDLDVSDYTPGTHSISARVKDSEGRWSHVVAKAFEFLPPISIIALSDINEPPYIVPRETTIHHYYAAKTVSGDRPVPGAVLNYQIGTDPTLRKSSPSDSDGIIDLNIKTGGENLSSNADDWIKVYNTAFPVQYSSIDKFPNVTNNHFLTNPFNITIKEKAEPTEKEVEMGLGISIKAASANVEKYEKKGKIGNVEYAFGPKLGASIMLGPSLSYTQSESNPSIWHVKSKIGIGASGEAGVESSVEAGKFSAELNGNVNAEIATTPGLYFDFNKDNARQVFELAKNLLLSNSFIPVGLYKAANFFRRASIDDSFPASPFTYTGSSVGASVSGQIEGNFKIEYSPTVYNAGGYAKWLQAGGGINLSGNRNMGIEIEAEKLKNIGRSLSVKTYSGVEMNAEFELLSNLTRRGDLDWWKASLPFKAFSSSKQNANILKNYYSTNDDLLHTEVNQASQKEISKNGLQTLSVTYNNITTFGADARGLLLVAKDGALEGNSIANFMYSNRPPYINYVNNIVTGLPLQSFSQSFLDTKNYILNNFNPNWTSDQFKQEITRDYSLELSEAALEIPRLASKLVDFKYNVANNYSFELEKSKFSKTYKRVFPTISLADNETNLDLPFSNPVQELFTNLKTNTEALPQNLFDKFMDFVIPVKQYLNNLIVCVGNGGCPSSSNAITSGESKSNVVIRKDLNANIIYDGSINTKNTSSSQNTQPSLMNFTVGPAPEVFESGTELYFDYYYPENNLLAITATDTMRIVSDVFTLFANVNGTELNQAPNGNFAVYTTWNSNDLVLAGMPQSLVPKVIFKPNGSNIWQIIGDVNQAINFNQLGVFAFGISLENDVIPPTISVQAPNTFSEGQILTVNITDNLSGINWNNTSIYLNGIKVPFTRSGSEVEITLPTSSNNAYFLQVLTYDYSFNYKSYEREYPCKSSALIRSLEGRSDALIIEKVSNFIDIDTQVPNGKDIILNAGKNIVFKPGFKIEAGQVMTAEIKGCQN